MVHCTEREEKGTLQNLQIFESLHVDAIMIMSTIEVRTDIHVMFDHV